jgi:3-phosphoshikimate 1-carboxyvinyltransferase
VYPAQLLITPKLPLDAELAVPGSKSLTNRALLVAALADGNSQLSDCLVAEDSAVMIAALRQLGIPVVANGTTISVHGQGGRLAASADLDLRLSGTAIRFLTALVTLGRGRYRLDGNARMRQRPIQDLLDALAPLGVTAWSELDTGCPPVIVEAGGLRGGLTQLKGDSSSQYLSALLMAAPYAEGPITIAVTGDLQSKPFVDMTLALMAEFGAAVEREGYERFFATPQRYRPRDYAIEGDAMAAGYFWAAAAVTGGRVKVTNLGSRSQQGDRRLAEVLRQMGCRVRVTETSTEVIAPADGVLRGGVFDLNDMPDQAQTLAVLGLLADRPLRIENVWNLRIKETDRLSAMATELGKLGAKVEEGRDYLVVHPLASPTFPETVVIDTYGDHRMAMAFAILGLRLGLTIADPACVAKTFPEFFEVLAAL